jgi:hypothetical protein
MKKTILLLLSMLPIFMHCTRPAENNSLALSVCESPLLKDSQIQDQISKVDFLVIDTTEALLSSIRKIIVDKELSIIFPGKNEQGILIVNSKGKMNGKINYLGGGPGEYIDITDFTYNFKTKEIIILDIVTKSVYAYDLKGKFKGQKKINMQATQLITDDEFYYFYTHRRPIEIGQITRIVVMNSDFKVVNSYFPNSESQGSNANADNVFSRNSDNQIFYSNRFVDTTYLITDKACNNYLLYHVANELPSKYLANLVLYNANFRNYSFIEGEFFISGDWLCLSTAQKARPIDYYCNLKSLANFSTAWTQLSTKIHLKSPIYSDKDWFYYSLSTEWIDQSKEQWIDFLRKFDREDLVNYFKGEILNFNPVIVKIKFKDKLNSFSQD